MKYDPTERRNKSDGNMKYDPTERRNEISKRINEISRE
jgi:hypothetical protein